MSKPTDPSGEFPGRTALTSRSASRRAALVGGMAVAGAAVLVPSAASAETRDQQKSARTAARRQNQDERGTFVVPQRHADDIPDGWTRHLLSRFSGGPSDLRLADVAAAGGIDAWFAAQLTPAQVPDPDGDALWSWFPVLSMTPAQRFQLSRQGAGAVPGWRQMQDLANWVMLRRLISARAVQEVMVDFWSNLLHVPSPASDSWVWRVEYEETIRANALGKFSNLLNAAILHPAMTLSMGNYMSKASQGNEDLGRELLDCHTVGVESGFAQRDVLGSARILTGYNVDTKGSQEQSYEPLNHWLGRVKVLSFSSPNAQPDGRPVIAKYLTYLARHPATAKRLCARLAVRFVSDTPSDDLVSSLAQTYLDADTNIVPVLSALVASDEFKAATMAKVRTPVEDAIATWAALGVQVAKPGSSTDAANQFTSVSKDIGQVPYDWPTPEGFPDVAPAWTSDGRLLGSMHSHWLAAIGHPTGGITFKTPVQWAPQLPTTFDNVVDYVVRSLLYLECTPTMLQAACVATDCKTTDLIDPTHSLIRFKFPRLLVSILDTPEHLSR